jgi:manganese/zinc/iron transport system permease protein
MIWDAFTDPVLRAPTLGSMLMCLASALVGVIVVLRKRSLVGEALSHAAYPGVVLAALFAAVFFPESEEGFAFIILIGAFLSALLGLWTIELLQEKFRVKADAALCFVLSVFFGFGILLASRVQFTHPLWYQKIQMFLYGQAATMTDQHVVIYGSLCLLTILFIALLYHPIQAVSFDRDFARSTGIAVKVLEGATFFLLVLAIVIGIRSVGVILMSGMLIAPVIAARQWTHRLFTLFVLSALFGTLSGFFGNYFSTEIPKWFSAKFSLPTGPMILLCASLFCFLSLLVSPGSGLCSRFFRIYKFRRKCRQENVLKAYWKGDEVDESRFFLWTLSMQGWLQKEGKGYRLTPDGRQKAAQIIRLHRLWEVYLVDYLGQGVERVHRNAEEMEHILTPELEKELTVLLQDPKRDPHHQPIPSKEGV